MKAFQFDLTNQINQPDFIVDPQTNQLQKG